MSVPLQVHRVCACCGNKAARFLYNNRMAPIAGLDMSYRVARCAGCGYVYANELPPRETYRQYYQKLSKYDQVRSIEQVSMLDRARARACVDICAPHLAPKCTVIDLGCGSGYLLHAFGEAGWRNGFGMDPAPSARQAARELFGITSVFRGSLSDAPKRLPLGSAGLVCLTAVLEHLWSPYEELKRISEKLQPGTLVLIEVPDLESFLRPPFEPMGELSLEHIQYFSARSLSRIMTRAGLQVIDLRILPIPQTSICTLLALSRVTAVNSSGREPDGSRVQSDVEQIAIDSYLENSKRLVEDVIDAIAAAPRPWVIYGAGSHTARLLPMLADRGIDQHIVGIVDANQNLQGQSIGRWTILPPSALDQFPSTTIVISSFRTQNLICAALSSQGERRLLRLYPELAQP